MHSYKAQPMRRFAFLIGVLLSSQLLAGDDSQPVVKWTLLDQNDRAYTLDDSAQVLLVARSMSAAKMLNAAIEDRPGGFLETRHIVYLADIEKMPALIKMVAVPAMRSAKYRIILDRDGRVATRYGGDRDTVQWLTLKNGAVIHEQRYADGAQLKQAITDHAP